MYNRMDMKKIALILVLIFVGSAVAACVLFFGQYGSDISSGTLFSDDIKNGIKVDVKKEEPVQGLDSILVETAAEDIRLIPSDSGEVTAHMNGSYYSSNKEDKPELFVERAGSTLKIKVEWSHKMHVLYFNSNLKLDVSIPRQYAAELKIQSSSGEIIAKDLTLDRFACKTTSGEVEAIDIKAAEANMETTSGGTTISGTFDNLISVSTSGELKAKDITAKTSSLKSTSGTIVAEGALGDLEARSTSGEIELLYREIPGKINASSSSGSVAIRLPENAGFVLDAGSTSGEITCDFPITTSSGREEHSLKGTVGDGKGNITVKTTSGEIALTK